MLFEKDVTHALPVVEAKPKVVIAYKSLVAQQMSALVSSGHGPHISLGEIIDVLSTKDRAVLILFPALLAVSPATFMFGVTTLCGVMIAMFCAQAILLKAQVWLPKLIRSYKMKRDTLLLAITRLDRYFHWVERNTQPRLSIFVSGPVRSGILIISLLLGIVMPFTELVPLFATVAGTAITLMLAGLLLKDGAVALVGVVITGLTLFLVSEVVIRSGAVIAAALA